MITHMALSLSDTMSPSSPLPAMMGPSCVTQTTVRTPLFTPWSRNQRTSLSPVPARVTWPWWSRWRRTRRIMTGMASHTTPCTSMAMKGRSLWPGVWALWKVPPLVQTWIMTSWVIGGRGSGPWLSCTAWTNLSITTNTDGSRRPLAYMMPKHSKWKRILHKDRRDVETHITNTHGSRSLMLFFVSGQEPLI